ncbi:MAG: hypothetical protein MR380_00980 [Lachnospiraceae bacterium]|nr:hypothetical protein [Lachnospiraceae bacterium]
MEETGRQIKCPGCGATLEFDAKSQKLKCPYCDTEVDMEAFSSDEKKERNTRKKSEKKQTDQEKKEDVRVITCKNCGAELFTDEYTTAAFCSYCGSSSLVESRLSGELMPDYVIPFKMDKNQAVEEYKKWTKKGFLTPKVFRSQAVIDKISGIYVPFWLYDYYGKIHAEGECVNTRFSSDSENDYTHRDYYYVCRDIEAQFVKVPADAAEKMDDTIMDKLEPFDYGELKPFQMEYLSGFLSERYNMEAEALEKRIEKRIDTYLNDFLKEELHRYEEKHVKENVILEKEKVRYVLLPVWMLNYRYQGKGYCFALNGQTGKIVGDLPVSKGKAAGIFVLAFLIMYAIIFLIGGIIL